MSQESINTTMLPQASSSDTMKLSRLILLLLRNWLVYLITAIVFMGGALYYLKHKYPTYLTETTILIEEESASPGQDLLEGFAVRPGVRNLDNQILVLSSHITMEKAVEELPFEIDIYRKGFLSELSYYPLNPIRIEPGTRGFPYQVEFLFQYLSDEKFKLSTSSNIGIEQDTILKFGQEIVLNIGSFIIYPQLESVESYENGEKIYFQFYNKEQLAEQYVERLEVENATRDGSIVRLSLEGTNQIKDGIFLDKLAEAFIEKNLEKKNLEAKRIIDFIEGQLQGVKDSLNITETRLQDFRSRNQIMDVSAQTQQIINQAVILEDSKAKLNLEGSYYSYLDRYLSQEGNDKRPIAPASMGIQDPNLNNLIQELSGLQAEYYSSGAGDRNPFQGQLELRIRSTKQSIKETLSGIMLANQMAITENDNQITRLNQRASRLPAKEQQLLGFQREFNLNNVLYTFLLERRAEAQIQKASNAPDHELVDRARSSGLVSPIPASVIAFALSLAVVLPSIILLLSTLFNIRIKNEDDVKFISNLPIIAQFPHSRLSYYNIVLTDSSSRIAEAFRNLRTRMEFFIKNEKCPLIVVSSSIPGEGKTFVSINLASVYSLMGLNTLLVGFDLRRPTLSDGFELNSEYGVVDYLIGRKTLDEVIQKSGYDNLDVLPSGSVPPNPAELSNSDKTKKLFSILKKKYDCIIVDSAPVGVVSDIYTVAGSADAMLMVLRHGHTKKHALSSTLSDLNYHNIGGVGLLINDVKLSTGGGYGYSYNYKYKYEYKNTEKKKKVWDILFNLGLGKFLKRKSED